MPGRHVVAVLLPRLGLGQPDTRDLGIRVDRPRHPAVVDHGVVAHRVLGRDLALAERRVRELPVPGAIADRVDVRDGRPPMLVGRDPLAPIELDADLLEPEPLDERPAPDRDEHEIRVHGLAVAEVNAQPVAGLLDLRALLLEMQRDPAPAELLRELLGRVVVLGRDQLRQHLDDRHLGAEAVEDRRELAADDPAAQDDEPARHLRLPEQALGVDAARGVEPLDRRPQRERAGGDDRALEGHVLPTLDRDRVRVLEAAHALDPLDAVRLEQARDAVDHLLDDAGLPLVGRREVELRRADLDAELGERVLGLLDRERGLHPGLRRDAADAQAGASELRLLLDADRLRAQLSGANRGRVAAGPPPRTATSQSMRSILSVARPRAEPLG